MNVPDGGRAWMRPIVALLLLLIVLASQAANAAGGTFGRAPVPSFAMGAAIPAPNPQRLRQVDGGLYDLLFDTQVRLENGTETTYRRRAYKLLDRSALEDGAQVTIPFDPAYENVFVHRVAIIRDGRVLDVTAKSELDAIRQEKDLDDGILDGTKTLIVRLPDVRVGDVIDASWSWVSRPPLWIGQYFGTFQLGWSVPTALTRVRIDLPAGTPLTIYRYRNAPSAAFRRESGRDVRQWIIVDPKPISDDEDSPEWYRPWPRVSMTTMPQWRNVVDWALPLYAAASQFPHSLDGAVARIERDGGPAELKALKALRLVQDNIRYTSLSIGTGSYKPRLPETVVRSGWGDCKDKTQLLIALLRRLGIEAWPALTDIEEGAALSREAPSPTVFDHIVTQIRIGGKTYWVDPTISHQGGTLATLAPLPYRFALPIRPGQAKLEAIPLTRPSAPTMETVETYRFDPKSIRLDVLTTYSAGEADDARARFASSALTERETKFLNYYANDLPGLQLRVPLAVKDDRSSNRLSVIESYLLPPGAYDPALLDKFPIDASSLEEIYTYPRGKRTHPLTLFYPIMRTHKIVLITPGMSASPPDEMKLDGKAFSFELETNRQREKLTILFSLNGKLSVLGPEAFAGYRKDADALATNTEWTLVIAPGADIPDWQAIGLVALFIALFVLFVAALIHANARKVSEQLGEQFYPVPLAKFVLLGAVTLGMYQAYWFWRQWRWVMRHEEAAIMPFWRAFFGVFWLYPLFSAANARAAPPLANWIGVTGAAMYLIWTVGTSLADRLVDSSLITGIGFLGPLFTLPALFAVNRANSAEIVRGNGKLGWLAIATIPIGLALVVLILITD